MDTEAGRQIERGNQLSRKNLDIQSIREQFPILNSQVGKNGLVYFDNAATTQKPKAVIDCISEYYNSTNANVHRGSHFLAAKATEEFEASRSFFKSFLNARSEAEITFTRGTTEGINLIANGFAQTVLQSGDKIFVSTMDHHSNIVPWQIAAQRSGAEVVEMPVNEAGELDMDWLRNNISEKVKMISTVYISNSLGTINPIKEIIELAHANNSAMLVDAAQTAPHQAIDVQELDCDFLALSGHKMFGPTGIGILYGKEAWMEELPPYQGGGEMIETVSFSGTTYNKLPYKFEAGTPNIAGAIALHQAGKFIHKVGYAFIEEQERALLDYGTQKLSEIDGLRIVGTAKEKASVISFVVDGIHNYDLATLLNQQGIAVRDGHHCCQPLMSRFGIEGTCRASFAFYNTLEEVDMLSLAIDKALTVLR